MKGKKCVFGVGTIGNRLSVILFWFISFNLSHKIEQFFPLLTRITSAWISSVVHHLVIDLQLWNLMIEFWQNDEYDNCLFQKFNKIMFIIEFYRITNSWVRVSVVEATQKSFQVLDISTQIWQFCFFDWIYRRSLLKTYQNCSCSSLLKSYLQFFQKLRIVIIN